MPTFNQIYTQEYSLDDKMEDTETTMETEHEEDINVKTEEDPP